MGLRKLLGLKSLRSFNSAESWTKRYASGGNSGAGSYGRLAEFKADTINTFVRDRNINSVIEFACGDGNQLQLAEYPMYFGVDVAPLCITRCHEVFLPTRRKLKHLSDYCAETSSKHGACSKGCASMPYRSFHRQRGLEILELTERCRAAAGPTPTAALLAAIGARAERVARRGTARHPRSPGTPIRGL